MTGSEAMRGMASELLSGRPLETRMRILTPQIPRDGETT